MHLKSRKFVVPSAVSVAVFFGGASTATALTSTNGSDFTYDWNSRHNA